MNKTRKNKMVEKAGCDKKWQEIIQTWKNLNGTRRKNVHISSKNTQPSKIAFRGPNYNIDRNANGTNKELAAGEIDQSSLQQAANNSTDYSSGIDDDSTVVNPDGIPVQRNKSNAELRYNNDGNPMYSYDGKPMYDDRGKHVYDMPMYDADGKATDDSESKYSMNMREPKYKYDFTFIQKALDAIGLKSDDDDTNVSPIDNNSSTKNNASNNNVSLKSTNIDNNLEKSIQPQKSDNNINLLSPALEYNSNKKTLEQNIVKDIDTVEQEDGKFLFEIEDDMPDSALNEARQGNTLVKIRTQPSRGTKQQSVKVGNQFDRKKIINNWYIMTGNGLQRLNNNDQLNVIILNANINGDRRSVVITRAGGNRWSNYKIWVMNKIPPDNINFTISDFKKTLECKHVKNEGEDQQLASQDWCIWPEVPSKPELKDFGWKRVCPSINRNKLYMSYEENSGYTLSNI